MADLLSSTSDMDKAELQSLVAKFVKGGDEQNVEILDDVLHPDYRITFAFPGETKVTILNREVYLQMLRDKKLGGRKRDTTIEDISIRGNIAVVRAKLQSPVMRFNIFFSFINTGLGWKLISDLPFAEMIG